MYNLSTIYERLRKKEPVFAASGKDRLLKYA